MKEKVSQQMRDRTTLVLGGACLLVISLIINMALKSDMGVFPLQVSQNINGLYLVTLFGMCMGGLSMVIGIFI